MVVAVVVVLFLTRSDSDKKVVTPPPTTTTRPPKPPAPLKLVIGRVVVQNVGPPAHVSRPLRRALLAAMQRYVDDAIIAPLEQGRLIAGYGKMYDPFVQGAALGSDRSVLTEVTMGFRQKHVHATASPVRLDALGGPDGRPVLVAATFSLNVDAQTSKGPLAIRRLTELTFSNEFGRWVVIAYNVGVRRTLGAHTRTAAAHVGATPPPA